MAIAYYIAPYVRKAGAPHPTRYVIVNDLTSTIVADGGDWREVEVLGNQAIVKVRASASTLTAINGLSGVTRIPLTRLDDSLSTLTAGQRNAIKQIILDAGYTMSEVDARFPNLANATIGDALRFLATRRLRPRYDSGTDAIVLDGQVEACDSVDLLDATVT